MSVYFVTCREANAVKIGSSLDPHSRLKEIQWGCPLELRLEGMMKGSHAEEFALHDRFADIRIRGEWFRLTEQLDAIIKNNPATDPLPESLTAAAKQEARSNRRWEGSIARRAREVAAEQEKAINRGKRTLQRMERSGSITFPFRQATESS